jgi:hypothetical protein
MAPSYRRQNHDGVRNRGHKGDRRAKNADEAIATLLPRYPLSAFSPHGQFIGEQIGEKADTEE